MDNPRNRDYVDYAVQKQELEMTDVAALTQLSGQIRGLDVGEVQTTLRRLNPKAPAIDLRAMAKIVAVVVDFVADMPKVELRELARESDQFRAALEEAAHQGKAQTTTREHIAATGRTVLSRGVGLGEQIPIDEGQTRLANYAKPVSIESWAGPVAGAGEIELQLGIPRSTLNSWHQRGAVIGLLRGERKFAYPLDQFVDARPLEGIADILRLSPDPRGAWLWLCQPNATLGQKSPLACLRAGRKAAVLEAAASDLPLEREFA